MKKSHERGVLRLLDALERWPKPLLVAGASAATALIYWVDAATGPEYHLFAFYLAVIFVMTWVMGFRTGLVFSSVSSVLWFLANGFERVEHPGPSIYWNTGMRAITFITTAYFVALSRELILREQSRSRMDPLTGLTTGWFFRELLAQELLRVRRYGGHFAVIFLDVDDFKSINDQFGHAKGDLVLQTIGITMLRSCRAPDVAARLGGDEFVLLLPQTEPEAASAFVHRMQVNLADALCDIRAPLTFSIGMVSIEEPPQTADETLSAADALMYAVKRSGKNGLRHEILGRPAACAAL